MSEAPARAASGLAAYGKLPLSFEPNRGQGQPGVRFLARGAGYGIALTQRGATIVLDTPKARSPSLPTSRAEAAHKGTTVALRFLSANRRVQVVGRDHLPGKVNYLRGSDPNRWLRGLPTYGAVRYEGLYPGIDARFYGRQGQLEYDLILAPGADPTRMTLALQGAEQLRLNSHGGLVVRVPGGTLVQRPPRIYQTIAGRRHAISGGYVLIGSDRFGFRVGRYDGRWPLVIDPVLSYSTYLGGSSDDRGLGIAVDTSGSAYVTGATASPDFPTTPGALDSSLGALSDAFVTKLAPGGSSLIYSTYLGGSSDGISGDGGYAIAVDGSGSAYVTGFTHASDFPTTTGAFDTSFNGRGPDAFVTKLAPSGSSLLYSTYLGGGNSGHGIAVDTAGSAYVTGQVFGGDFPTTPGAFDTSFNGFSDAFVSKFAASGSTLLYSSYVGGLGDDRGRKLVVDNSGSAYLTGFTDSSDFPTTPAAFDTSFGGHSDGFVTKVAPNGSSLGYSTYLGGSGQDVGYATAFGIAVDRSGSAYVTGTTHSADFPTTPGAFDTSLNGSSDAFVSKIAPSGSSLTFSTYVGGSFGDSGQGIAVDASGSAHVTGVTDSADFPNTPGAFDSFLGGESDAFVTKLAPGGSMLVDSTYLGGTGFDIGNSIAIDAFGDAYVTGVTFSFDFPTTPGAFDTSFNGFEDTFIIKLPATAITVLVDIKPGSERNPITLAAHGLIPVAILSTASFDATTVDPASVCFGDAEEPSERDCSEAHGKGHVEDVNGDGRPDLILHFEVRETGIDPGDTRACLTGETSTGGSVEGCDSIKTL